MKTYLFRYRFCGAEYGFEIPADSEREARARLSALQYSAEYDGELVATVPAVIGAGFMVRVLTRVRNLFRES